jgi:hypothetical protein
MSMLRADLDAGKSESRPGAVRSLSHYYGSCGQIFKWIGVLRRVKCAGEGSDHFFLAKGALGEKFMSPHPAAHGCRHSRPYAATIAALPHQNLPPRKPDTVFVCRRDLRHLPCHHHLAGTLSTAPEHHRKPFANAPAQRVICTEIPRKFPHESAAGDFSSAAVSAA